MGFLGRLVDQLLAHRAVFRAEDQGHRCLPPPGQQGRGQGNDHIRVVLSPVVAEYLPLPPPPTETGTWPGAGYPSGLRFCRRPPAAPGIASRPPASVGKGARFLLKSSLSSAPSSHSMGAGIVASTQKGPVTPVTLPTTSGRSTWSTSLSRGFVVGDGFKGDVGHDAAHLFAFLVLLAGHRRTRPPAPGPHP